MSCYIWRKVNTRDTTPQRTASNSCTQVLFTTCPLDGGGKRGRGSGQTQCPGSPAGEGTAVGNKPSPVMRDRTWEEGIVILGQACTGRQGPWRGLGNLILKPLVLDWEHI